MTETPTPTGGEPEPRSEAFTATADEPEIDDDELDPRARAAMQKLRRECRSLRTRLHETEEEVGAQAAREMVRHRATIEAAAKAAGLVDGSDFTLHHPDPAPFLDEEFKDVVGDRVTEAAAALLEQKPYLGRAAAPPTDRPIESLRPGASPEPAKKIEATWASALRGGR